MDFLVLFNVMIIQERSTSENDRRKCVRVDSVWLHINRISQKQEFPFFGTAVRAEVHVTCRPWIKNVAHAVRRICVALSVLAKPMKESCSGRKGDRFQQQSWRLWSFRRGFFSWRLNTCCRSKRCSPSFAESGWMECEAKSSFSAGNVFCDLGLWLRLPVNRLSSP